MASSARAVEGGGRGRRRRLLWEYAACHRQISVTAGTIFPDSRLPLTRWLRAVWWLTNQKNGVSTLGLQRVLGWKSYKTAWIMLHKLRLRPVPDASAESLMPFSEDSMEPGTVVHTDGWLRYQPLTSKGCRHKDRKSQTNPT